MADTICLQGEFVIFVLRDSNFQENETTYLEFNA